ncbi:fatty acid desaturase [uncultured Sneathiella sp.]|uniref:fatty acid desaturase n=1 Tax=uncultured Sneathiella sp. TaxID=879315 RepID=UPI0030EC3A1E|tara:strand:- start:16200 stop:17045 length:846 start_codon:yes stop_codon:yes gene_type:complete
MLTRRSDIKGLVHLAGHAGLILLIGALIALKGPGWQLLMLPQGILILFLFTALHESVHRTAYRSLWLNKATAWLSGLLIVLPPEWFRYFHIEHHRFTQDPMRDPELQRPKPATLAGYIWHVSGLPIWASHLRTLIRNAAGRCTDPFVPAHGRASITREARGMLLLYALLAGGSIAAGSTLLLYVWIIPALLGQPFLRLYLLAEHGLCPETEDSFTNTRTTMSNPVMRKLAWNMPFHAEHHAFPAVPFHALENLHMLMRPHLRETERGYIAFHRRYFSQLRR